MFEIEFKIKTPETRSSSYILLKKLIVPSKQNSSYSSLTKMIHNTTHRHTTVIKKGRRIMNICMLHIYSKNLNTLNNATFGESLRVKRVFNAQGNLALTYKHGDTSKIHIPKDHVNEIIQNNGDSEFYLGTSRLPTSNNKIHCLFLIQSKLVDTQPDSRLQKVFRTLPLFSATKTRTTFYRLTITKTHGFVISYPIFRDLFFPATNETNANRDTHYKNHMNSIRNFNRVLQAKKTINATKLKQKRKNTTRGEDALKKPKSERTITINRNPVKNNTRNTAQSNNKTQLEFENNKMTKSILKKLNNLSSGNATLRDQVLFGKSRGSNRIQYILIHHDVPYPIRYQMQHHISKIYPSLKFFVYGIDDGDIRLYRLIGKGYHPYITAKEDSIIIVETNHNKVL